MLLELQQSPTSWQEEMNGIMRRPASPLDITMVLPAVRQNMLDVRGCQLTLSMIRLRKCQAIESNWKWNYTEQPMGETVLKDECVNLAGLFYSM